MELASMLNEVIVAGEALVALSDAPFVRAVDAASLVSRAVMTGDVGFPGK
jgi:hypothetical protein